MSKSSGLTRGDRRRNRQIGSVRQVVRPELAILAIDLGEDKQVAVVMDHDRTVLARRVVNVKAHQLGRVLDWAAKQADGHGFAGVVVGCEPTGHRWRAVMQLADRAGMAFACVQPLRVHNERLSDSYTWDKTDHRDAVLIGRVMIQGGCYLAERPTPAWNRLRHLGATRTTWVARSMACQLQIRDLLGCCWPEVLSTAARPLESDTWVACLAVVHAAGDDLERVAGAGAGAFTDAVRAQLPRLGRTRLCLRIVRAVFTAMTDAEGVRAQRDGALERVGLIVEDWLSVRAGLAEIEGRMIDVLDELDLTAVVTSIPGLSAVGAATILAETGDLSRFESARSVVKHAGLNPVERTSGTMRGTTRISHRGRSGLRTAAWRAVKPALTHNPVLAARFTHLTTRARDQLTPGQAHAACGATLLRWLHALVTRREMFDPAVARGEIRRRTSELAAA
jgi:transposase